MDAGTTPIEECIIESGPSSVNRLDFQFPYNPFNRNFRVKSSSRIGRYHPKGFSKSRPAPGDRLDMWHRGLCMGLMIAVVWQTILPCCLCAAAKSQTETRNADGCCCCKSHSEDKNSSPLPMPRKNGHRGPKCPFCQASAGEPRLAKAPIKIRGLESGESMETSREILTTDHLRIACRDSHRERSSPALRMLLGRLRV